MTGEVQAFTEFMKRANDSERATLRLAVAKLRRGASQWLQVAVRMLDHVPVRNGPRARAAVQARDYLSGDAPRTLRPRLPADLHFFDGNVEKEKSVNKKNTNKDTNGKD
jgi:hypothetical protein